MDIDELRGYCLEKAHTCEGFPFDNDTLVFKVAGKMFALVGLDKHPLSVNLKCDPERALDLREQFESILPGYHMNKQHWNTVILDGSIPLPLLLELIDHSYNLIYNSLPQKTRNMLEGL
jgi:predicted DNA-binding protein (MmcQ/YjbR family)